MPAEDSWEAFPPPFTRGRSRPDSDTAQADQLKKFYFTKQFTPAFLAQTPLAYPQDSSPGLLSLSPIHHILPSQNFLVLF
jgi:hypothetical protein